MIDSPSARKRLADAKAALAAASGGGGGASVDLARPAEEPRRRRRGRVRDRPRGRRARSPTRRSRPPCWPRSTRPQQHYEAAAKTSQQLLAAGPAGLASIGDAVAALGAAQRAQAKAAYDLASRRSTR